MFELSYGAHVAVLLTTQALSSRLKNKQLHTQVQYQLLLAAQLIDDGQYQKGASAIRNVTHVIEVQLFQEGFTMNMIHDFLESDAVNTIIAEGLQSIGLDPTAVCNELWSIAEDINLRAAPTMGQGEA